MAKTQKEAGEVVESLPLPEAVTFIDQEYTRRTLVLPDWLVLEVVRGQVTLAGDDAPGLAYMRNRPDFKEA
ncbi:hypothetical protein RBU55_07535 [Pseudomonas chlororaphis subsp. aurantiaca]|uniref:hypothetical protein n=1 Tax=Pseudomonas chlororaphis TaxID=587753 RepID=UPI0027DD3FA0|nr:hypothetical protein [Pseudomonas chlororaphis]WMJ01396.1 hypothetical protein RBU55_07535 [Pseudomonas chlororaphis subsp. aurantiaca]